MNPWDLTTYSSFSRYQPIHTWVCDPAISKVKRFAGFDSTLFVFLFAVATSFSVILPSATNKLGKPSLGTRIAQGMLIARLECQRIHSRILPKVIAWQRPGVSVDLWWISPLGQRRGSAGTCHQNRTVRLAALQIMGTLTNVNSSELCRFSY